VLSLRSMLEDPLGYGVGADRNAGDHRNVNFLGG
jgi:hypothetical protein